MIWQVGDKKMWVHFGGSENSINESHRSMIIDALHHEQEIFQQVEEQLANFCDRGYFVISVIWKGTPNFLSFLFKDNMFSKLEVVNPRNMLDRSL